MRGYSGQFCFLGFRVERLSAGAQSRQVTRCCPVVPTAAVQVLQPAPLFRSPIVPQHLLHAITRHLHKPAGSLAEQESSRMERLAVTGGLVWLVNSSTIEAGPHSCCGQRQHSPLAGIDEGAVRERGIGHDDCRQVWTESKIGC